MLSGHINSCFKTVLYEIQPAAALTAHANLFWEWVLFESQQNNTGGEVGV